MGVGVETRELISPAVGSCWVSRELK